MNRSESELKLMGYNPMQLRMQGGQMRDKYGRVFEFKPRKMKTLRKPLNAGGRVLKSYHAHEPA